MLNLQLEEIKATKAFTRFTYRNMVDYSVIKTLEIEYNHGAYYVTFYDKEGNYLNSFNETSFREITQPLVKRVIRLHESNF